ncbi:RNA-guided endonuclease InsQ/TnpB family protein [Spirillospora sp. NPDC048911]|uniref:RNA-guided endonuclease InsQ/TnpB family protein n=1 Tax=Spirillospora sp. NPDC048911 TaxID=3364527 RepID=UPI003717BC0B
MPSNQLGWIKFRQSRPLGGRIRSVTLRWNRTHWQVSFLVETGHKAPLVSLERGRVGVDRGVATAVATSDGRFFHRVFLTDGERERLRRLEKQRHRCRPGSRRRRPCITKINAVRERERNRRRDFHAQTAAELLPGMALVVLENLNISGMTASAKGTLDRPGTNVRAKAGLNSAIPDKGWYGFEPAVRNVARRTGAEIRKIHPARTSQTCPVCRMVDADSRKSQAKFVCTSCGHAEHADTVGAINTLAAGHGGHRTWRPRGCPVREASTGPPGNRPGADLNKVGISHPRSREDVKAGPDSPACA